MSKHHQTTKHKKQAKKERANRKARQHQQVTASIEQKIVAEMEDGQLPPAAPGAIERIVKVTELKVVCAWCKKDMGSKDGEGTTGTSHSICPDCSAKEQPITPVPCFPKDEISPVEKEPKSVSAARRAFQDV